MILLSLFNLLENQAPAGRTGGSPLNMFIMMGIVFVIFYLLIIMPQRKKQKKHQEQVEALKPGVKIVTTGGIFGTVMGVQKDKIELKISSNVKVDITKNAVAVILSEKKEEK